MLDERFSKVQMITLTEDQAGQRVDNYLITLLKGVPKSRIYRILRKGEVRVNRKRVKPESRLQAGDEIRLPPIRVEEKAKVPPAFHLQERIDKSVVYEDDALLVIDKPSGIAVHGGSGVSHGVIEGLRALRPDARFLELVHRLDRDTSGLLMIAKKRSMLRFLHDALRNGKVEKRYRALLGGRWKGSVKRVTAPLLKFNLPSGERMVKVDEAGKRSASVFTPLQRYKQGTLVQVELETGRTHQIRVHSQYLGYPVAGDSKYGNDDQAAPVLQCGLDRLFLHAYQLVTPLPDGRELDLTAPLSDELIQVLDCLIPID